MKVFLFLGLSLLLVNLVNAQLNRSKDYLNVSSDTTWHSTGQFSRQKVANGNVLVHTQAGKYKLYASYKNNAVTGYYAIDATGTKVNATVSRRGKGGCYYCIRLPEPNNKTLVLCWWTDPCQASPERPTTKTAN